MVDATSAVTVVSADCLDITGAPETTRAPTVTSSTTIPTTLKMRTRDLFMLAVLSLSGST
jgi:hypothetical protein